MVKICLINPPLYKKVRQFNPPLGLAYIASYIGKFGYDCDILDANALRKDNDTIVEEVKDYQIVLITTVTIGTPIIIDLINKLKAKNPDILIVLGGAYSTSAYKILLKKYKNIDLIVLGEGEVTTLEIIKAYEKKEPFSKIDGIAFLDKKVIRTKDRELIKNLDDIPFPRFDKLPMERYLPSPTNSLGIKKGKTGFMITARGCPYNCTYCANNILWNKARYRSAKNIIEEIKFLKKEYGIKQIVFQDDTLTTSKERLEEICDFLANENIKWTGFARVNEIIDRKLLEKMYNAGCYQLSIGFESADQDILNRCRKGINVKDSIKAIKLCNEVGIGTLAFFIFGLPGETKKTIMKTIDFIKSYDFDIVIIYILLPYNGTEIYNELVKKKIINEDYADEFSDDCSVFLNPLISVCSLPIEELRDFRSYALRQFYFSRKFLFRTMKKLIKSPRSIVPLILMVRNYYYYLGELLKLKGD